MLVGAYLLTISMQTDGAAWFKNWNALDVAEFIFCDIVDTNNYTLFVCFVNTYTYISN